MYSYFLFPKRKYAKKVAALCSVRRAWLTSSFGHFWSRPVVLEDLSLWSGRLQKCYSSLPPEPKPVVLAVGGYSILKRKYEHPKRKRRRLHFPPARGEHKTPSFGRSCWSYGDSMQELVGRPSNRTPGAQSGQPGVVSFWHVPVANTCKSSNGRYQTHEGV